MLLQHIKLMYVLLGMAVAVIAQLVIVPEKKVIVRYPEPSKAGSMTFRDSNGACFKFKTEEVNCSSNEGSLLDFPLQN